MHPPTLALIALALLSPLQAMADNRPALRICYEIDDYPPFIGAFELAKPGLLLELIQAAARQAEVDLEFQRQPWKRCILQLQQGLSDGIFAAIWQAERDSWGQFPGRAAQRDQPADRHYRLWQADYPIFTRRDSNLQWDGQQFSGLQHGLSAPLGYVSRQRLHYLGALASASYSPEKAFELVALDRLDGYVIERQIGASYVRKLGLQQQLAPLPRPLLQADWYLPLSHQFYARQPQLARRFWQALREQRERRGAELSRRYLQPDD